MTTDRHLSAVLNTEPATDPTTESEAAPAGPRWRQALAELPELWRNRATLYIQDHWLFGLFVLTALLLVGGMLWTAWMIVGWLVTSLVSTASAAGDGLAGAGRWLADGPITHTVVDSLRAWLDTNTAGLPATGGQLAVLWAVVAAVVYLQALLGSLAARIGWGLVGAATTTVVYAGAHPAGAAGAAATAAAVWLLLSVPAYARASSLLDQLIRDHAKRHQTRLRIAEHRAEAAAHAARERTATREDA